MISHPSHLRKTASRRGAMVFELVVTGSILAVTMTFVVPILGRIAEARRDVARQETALRIVRNTAEELLAGTSTPESIALPAGAADRFENATLTVERTGDSIAGSDDVVPFRVALSWQSDSLDAQREVALTVWLSVSGERE